MLTIASFLSNLSWSFNGWTFLILLSEVSALLTIPSVLRQRRGQPLAALSWTLTLLGLPLLGVVGWWALGRTHLERKRGKRRRSRAALRPALAALRPALPDTGEHLAPGPGEGGRPGVYPAEGGNRAAPLSGGEAVYQALEEAIGSARDHIHLLFYIWQPDGTGRRFRDLLAEKARQGVKVRVLLDGLGSHRAARSFMDPLRRAGGSVAAFMPSVAFPRPLALNFRNHRKIAVVDGRVGYTGGINIGDEYRRWRDLGLLFTGPVVGNLQEVFLEDWYFAAGEDLAGPGLFEGATPVAGGDAVCRIIAGGPDSRDNPTLDAFFLAINRARERVWVTTPYLAPGPEILAALRTSVLRGVDVRLLVPQKSDLPLARLVGRSWYPALLAAGIRVFEYQPEVLHAKAWVFDREEAAVGSANLDNRSFRLNFECTCFVRGGEVNRGLASRFSADLAHSHEVTAEGVGRAGWARSLAESAANLLSPLM